MKRTEPELQKTSRRYGEARAWRPVRFPRWGLLPVLLVMAIVLLPAGKAAASAVVGPVTALPGDTGVPAVSGVLSRIPADAHVVIAVGNLRQLSDRLAVYNSLLNLNLPPLANTLNFLKGQLGAESIRDEGGAALVLSRIPSPTDGEGGPEVAPVPVFLLPTVDSAAMIRSLRGDPAQAVAEVTLPAGDIAYLRAAGRGYVLMAPDREAVERFAVPGPDGASWGRSVVDSPANFRSVVGHSDIHVLVNLEAAGESLRQWGKFASAAVGDMGLAAMGAEAEIAVVVMQMYVRVAEMLLEDGRLLAASIELSSRGLGLDFAVAFKPESEVGRLIRRGPPAHDAMHWLPDRSFLIAGNIDFTGVETGRLFGLFHAGLPEETQKHWVTHLIRHQAMMMAGARRGANALYWPEGGPAGIAGGSGSSGGAGASAGLESFTVTEMGEDAQRALNSFRRSLGTMSGVRLPAGPDDDGEARPMFRTTYRPAALTIDGVVVDFFSVQTLMELGGHEGMPEPLAELLGSLGGGGDTVGSVMIKDGRMVVASTQDAASLRRFLAQVGQQQGGLAARRDLVNLRRLALHRPANAELMIGLQEVTQFYRMLSPLLGLPAVEVPRQMPPILLALTTDDAAVSGRIFSPTPLNRFLGGIIGAVAAQQMQPQPPPPARDDDRPPRPPAF